MDVVPIPEQHPLGDAGILNEQGVGRRLQPSSPSEGQAVQPARAALADGDGARGLSRIEHGLEGADPASAVLLRPGGKGQGVPVDYLPLIRDRELQNAGHPLAVQPHPGQGHNGLPPGPLRLVDNGACDHISARDHLGIGQQPAAKEQQPQEQGQGIDGLAPNQQQHAQRYGGKAHNKQQASAQAQRQKGSHKGARDAPEHGPLVEILALRQKLFHMGPVYPISVSR